MQKFIVTFVSILLFSVCSLFGQNLVVNGDLELWDDVNTPTSWDKAEDITQESSTIHGGTYSALHQAVISSTRDIQQNVSGIEAGKTYDIVYYYFDNDPAARTRIWSYWLSGTSTVTDNATELRPSTYSSDNATWQEYNQRLVAPAGVDGFRFEVRVYNEGTGGGVVYYDDFSVTEVTGIDNPPSIGNLSNTPKVPAADGNTTVTADVTDDSGITLVELRYTVNGGSRVDATMSNSGDTYNADIPSSAYTDGDLVECWVYAEDDATSPQSSESTHIQFFVGAMDIADVKLVDLDGVLVYDGVYAQLTGIATVENGTFHADNMDVYIQDATGGINVFMYSQASHAIEIGHEYTVVGALAQYNGKGEIIPDDVADITDEGASTVPDAAVVTIATLSADPETYEGMLVQVVDADYVSGTWPASGSNATIVLNDGTGSGDMYIDRDTDIDESLEGDYPMDVTGIFSQYDNSSPYDGGYQLLPRAVTDFNWGSSAIERLDNSAIITEFKLHSNFPNPFNPSTTLQFDVPNQVDNLNLSVYNTAGQKIATLYNGSVAQGTYQYTWNGVNQANQVAPSGIYFAVLKTVDFTQSIKMMLIK